MSSARSTICGRTRPRQHAHFFQFRVRFGGGAIRPDPPRRAITSAAPSSVSGHRRRVARQVRGDALGHQPRLDGAAGVSTAQQAFCAISANAVSLTAPPVQGGDHRFDGGPRGIEQVPAASGWLMAQRSIRRTDATQASFGRGIACKMCSAAWYRSAALGGDEAGRWACGNDAWRRAGCRTLCRPVPCATPHCAFCQISGLTPVHASPTWPFPGPAPKGRGWGIHWGDETGLNPDDFRPVAELRTCRPRFRAGRRRLVVDGRWATISRFRVGHRHGVAGPWASASGQGDRRAGRQGDALSNLYRIPQAERLAQRLVDASFADSVFFCNSGAEANEGMIKMMRRAMFDAGKPERFRSSVRGRVPWPHAGDARGDRQRALS